MDISKTKSSFYRRLYMAYLIDNGIDNVPAIIKHSGMPRRTAQDTIKSLNELDIICKFKQTRGERNHSGHYHIERWGAIDKQWVNNNIDKIKELLNYP
ncbi:winged helix-turn-helix domain-containing protein [Photobacterium leiognathi]|uniref:winged helix-turn-helix domain-containing protein n=1 Tax=Photobacterium leiognathi TaxID=553611 RepID=UPI002735BCEC|nr:winged helix-turn-helix domain-containing protein [Photobacterium leiognathi]